MPSTNPEPDRLVDFGAALRTHREELKLSEASFAAVAGLTYSQVARLERGEVLQNDDLVLSRYLQCLMERDFFVPTEWGYLGHPGA